jgi:hypothetical protein
MNTDERKDDHAEELRCIRKNSDGEKSSFNSLSVFICVHLWLLLAAWFERARSRKLSNVP